MGRRPPPRDRAPPALATAAAPRPAAAAPSAEAKANETQPKQQSSAQAKTSGATKGKVVQSCDLCRVRHVTYTKTDDPVQCFFCKQQSVRLQKTIRCTFNKSFTPGVKNTDAPSLKKTKKRKKPNKKRSKKQKFVISADDVDVHSPSIDTLPTGRRSSRRNVVAHDHLAKFDAGMKDGQDLLSFRSAHLVRVDANNETVLLLLKTLKLSNNDVSQGDPITSWDCLPRVGLFVREFEDPKRNRKKVATYGSIRVSDECAKEVLGVGNLAEVLPPDLQLKKIVRSPQKTVANPTFFVNVNKFTTMCHTDSDHSYMHVLKGHKIVILARSCDNVPGKWDGGPTEGATSLFDPFVYYWEGRMEELADKFKCTVHHVWAGRGILIPRGMPHCIHNTANTVGLAVSVDEHLRSNNSCEIKM